MQHALGSILEPDLTGDTPGCKQWSTPEQGNPANISARTSTSLAHRWKNRHPPNDSFLLAASPFIALLARHFVILHFFSPPLQGNAHSTKTNPLVHSLSARWLPTARSTTWRQLLTTVLSTTTAINISNSARNGAELEHSGGKKQVWKEVIMPSAVWQTQNKPLAPKLHVIG